MRLSELQSKNIVSVVDGKNIGNIIDVNVMMDGRIAVSYTHLTLPTKLEV